MDNKQEIETVDIFLNFQDLNRLAINSHDGFKFDWKIYPVLVDEFLGDTRGDQPDQIGGRAGVPEKCVVDVTSVSVTQ